MSSALVGSPGRHAARLPYVPITAASESYSIHRLQASGKLEGVDVGGNACVVQREWKDDLSQTSGGWKHALIEGRKGIKRHSNNEPGELGRR